MKFRAERTFRPIVHVDFTVRLVGFSNVHAQRLRQQTLREREAKIIFAKLSKKIIFAEHPFLHLPLRSDSATCKNVACFCNSVMYDATTLPNENTHS